MVGVTGHNREDVPALLLPDLDEHDTTLGRVRHLVAAQCADQLGTSFRLAVCAPRSNLCAKWAQGWAETLAPAPQHRWPPARIDLCSAV